MSTIMKGADGFYYHISATGAVRCDEAKASTIAKTQTENADQDEYTSLTHAFEGNGTDFAAVGHGFALETNEKFIQASH